MPPADLAERIPELMARARVPGLSVAYVEDGQLAWNAAFGRKHRDWDEPVDADTVFQAASLSKPVFAYAVLKLVEQGVLTLDEPLASYWRAPARSEDALAEQVTARQVLCHTTGWPNWRPAGQPLRREAAPRRPLRLLGRRLRLPSALRRARDRPATGCPHPGRRIRANGRLDSSSYGWAAQATAAAAGHDRDGAPSARHLGEHPNAASSLHTTPRDFARFVPALLTLGDEPRRLGQASASEMLRPQARSTRGSRGAWAGARRDRCWAELLALGRQPRLQVLRRRSPRHPRGRGRHDQRRRRPGGLRLDRTADAWQRSSGLRLAQPTRPAPAIGTASGIDELVDLARARLAFVIGDVHHDCRSIEGVQPVLL